MSRLSTQLLALAQRLLAGKPNEAELRRAVSTAYYAVFHLLVEEAGLAFLPGRKAQFRPFLSRAFQHGEMEKCAQVFAKTSRWPHTDHLSSTGQAAPLPQLPQELRDVAQTFGTLQAARHKADYALARKLTISEARASVSQAEQAFVDWKKVRRDPSAALFLLALLIQSRVRSTPSQK